MAVLVFFLVAVLSLATRSIEGKLSFSLSNSPADEYKNVIQLLRRELTINSTSEFYGVRVLQSSVPDSQRYMPIDVTNVNGETITVALDVVSLQIVGYCSENKSHIFKNAGLGVFLNVCPNTCKVVLEFGNDYESIENAAGTTRLETPLGFDPLDSAISNLYHYRRESVPEALLVIMQMVVGAVKFKIIEQSVVNSIKNEYSFKPSLAMVSLENNWSKLSSQIQASRSLQGLFGEAVEFYDSNNNTIEVDSIYFPMTISNIALLVYYCNVSAKEDNVPLLNFIRMPTDDALNNDNSCYVQTRTTHIVGQAGLCADVENGYSDDGNPIILYPCGQQSNKKWTFQSDWTIRSLGKCLTMNSSNSIMIYDCNKVESPGSIKWEVSIDGTISNPSSGLVLTANEGTTKTKLVGEANKYSTGQGWRVGNYVQPIIASIIGLRDMCLEATNGITSLWLENCVKNKTEQYWAVYSDGTIRVNSTRTLCVSSSGDQIRSLITILKCNGSPNQRWVFTANGSILNPKTEMQMDVYGADVSAKRIILFPKTGNSNQQWVLFY